jgi:hypothetical protein
MVAAGAGGHVDELGRFDDVDPVPLPLADDAGIAWTELDRVRSVAENPRGGACLSLALQCF